MVTRFALFHLYKQLIGAIVNVVIKVQNAQRRTMGNQHICISRNIRNMFTLPVCNAISHAHGYAVNLPTVEGNAVRTKIVAIGIKPFDVCILEAVIMIAGDDNFMCIRQVTEPVKKIYSFANFTTESKVTGMNNHVSFGKVFQPPVLTVSVGYV